MADKLKLTVNLAKSAVASPWERKFLGYSLVGTEPRNYALRRPAINGWKRACVKCSKVREGCSLSTFITRLNALLRGWMAYFRLSETEKALEELDGWIRHKLRCILWRQWKRPYTHAMNLMQAGLKEEPAFRSAFNQRGPWWNSGASHMNQSFPKSFFDRLGLVSILDTMRRIQSVQ